MNSGPSYLKSYSDGSLDRAIEKSFRLLESCSICPRKCGVNRLKQEIGFCKTGLLPKAYSFMPHHGEEPPLSGSRGSGTIFFSCCNMGCIYCQNYEFSQSGEGREVTFTQLAQFMLDLQEMNCHNINLVTPTHIMPQILQALKIAISKGLNLPLVYNTGGYELAEVIKLLDGIVDIYLVDMRYADEKMAITYSCAPGYPRYNQGAVKQMHRQVGLAQMDKEGIIKQGVIIRHLVLPNNISGTGEIMQFIREQISPDSYISLMSQYLPYYKAPEYPDLNRRLKIKEYEEAKAIMQKNGLSCGWIQESYGLERFAGVHIKPYVKTDDST